MKRHLLQSFGFINTFKKKTHSFTWEAAPKITSVISDFYRTTRYSRYNLESVFTINQDFDTFVIFVKIELHIKDEHGIVPMVKNSQKVKNFIGKLIGKISSEIFLVIKKETNKLKIKY